MGVTAVNDVSFSVARGETVALIGPNGAGKSSLFNCITALYKPQVGSVRFEGVELTRLTPDRIAALGVARTFQNIELFGGLTVLENLLLGRHRHVKTNLFQAMLGLPAWTRDEVTQIAAAERIIDLLELQAYRDRRVRGLPYGIQKLVEIGRALAGEPKLLLMDEPVAGLTTDEKDELVGRLAELKNALGLSILLVEHDLRVVSSLAERIIVLEYGRKIADGSPEAVRNDPAVVAAYLGVEAQTLQGAARA
ncbi:MAG: ABC transporter ATP-binding protein [Pleurocapsa sp. SU_196_0]|nr:ABC transporter ATP-binding protein [Pleurocapsa sp. SU_196_0]